MCIAPSADRREMLTGRVAWREKVHTRRLSFQQTIATLYVAFGPNHGLVKNVSMSTSISTTLYDADNSVEM